MRNIWRRGVSSVLPGTLSFAILLLLWEWLVRLLAVSPLILPPPSQIIQEFIKRADQISMHAAVTLVEVISGLCIGVGFALVISLLISEVPLFRRAIYPLIMAKQVVPTVVFAPIL